MDPYRMSLQNLQHLLTRHWFYMNHLKDTHVYQLTLFGETTEFHG